MLLALAGSCSNTAPSRLVRGRISSCLQAVAEILDLRGALANENGAHIESLHGKHNWISTLTIKIDMDDKLLS